MTHTRCTDVNTTPPAGFHLDMTVAADPAHWPQVLLALERLSQNLQWSEATAMRVQLVTEEWALNAMTYGKLPDCADAWVRVALRDAPEAVELEFSDNGAPFNPLAVPDKVLPDSLDEAHVGGLGLHLIRQLARAMDYARDGSCNRLRVELAKDPPHM